MTRARAVTKEDRVRLLNQCLAQPGLVETLTDHGLRRLVDIPVDDLTQEGIAIRERAHEKLNRPIHCARETWGHDGLTSVEMCRTYCGEKMAYSGNASVLENVTCVPCLERARDSFAHDLGRAQARLDAMGEHSENGKPA